MARYLTEGMVALADGHPNSAGAIAMVVVGAERPYVLADETDIAVEREVFREVFSAKRYGLTAASALRSAADADLSWVAMRRDLAEPRELLGQLLEATGRYAKGRLSGFAVLLAPAEIIDIDRILAIVDRSDSQPSGLMILAAVAVAEKTGAAIDVLVVGAPNEQVDSSMTPQDVLLVERDKDLFEQARRRSERLERHGSWMFIDHVTNRVQLVLDVLAADEYDLVVDDLGDVRLGGRIGRGGRIERALQPGAPGSIACAVLEHTDLPLLLVLDAVRLGIIPPKLAAGAGAGVLTIGILAAAAPSAAASPAERSEFQTSVSQSVEAMDAALESASSMAGPAAVADAQAEAHAAADDAEAIVAESTGQEADEEASDDQAADDQGEEGQAADEESQTPTEDESTAADEDAASEDAAAEEQSAADDTSPADLAPEDVTPEEADEVDAGDIEVSDDLSQSDVSEAQDNADDSEAALDEAEEDFATAQEQAIDAQAAAEEAAASAAEASDALTAANDHYSEVSTQSEAVIDDATGLTGALPGGAGGEDLAAAEASEAEALTELDGAALAADEAVDGYEEAATSAVDAQAELEDAAAAVTDAQTDYNQDQATAQATQDAYQEQMAEARVSPVAEGEYTPTGHYHDEGPYWSLGYHTGEDYAAPVGTDVVAAGSGTVVEVTHDDPAYGNRIVIEHEDGYYTTYNHLSQIDVEEGQQVTAGDTIGEVGATGNVTGPHLHFEVTHGGDGWSGGEFVSPDAWLSGEVA